MQIDQLPLPKKTSHKLIIEPSSGWNQLGLHELWQYRDLIYFLLLRDIKARYQQMALGPLWIVLNPLMNLVVFTVIFGNIADLPSDGLPYPLFAYSALLPWTLFSTVAQGSAQSLLQYKQLISKVYFPRLVVPIVSMLVALVDFLISFVILLVMVAAYGYTPGLAVITLPLYLFLAMATGLAIGLWSATWVVHFRDVNSLLGYLLRLWMYATPVVYDSSVVPDSLQTIYRLNPMTAVIESFRWGLLGVGNPPDLIFVVANILVLIILVAGAFYFRHTERSIVDIA